MLIYVSTADVDSLCAFRVLKLMLRSDNVAYSVFPVSGYGELQRLGGEIPDDGQQRAIVLINCGGTEDVKSVLGLREGARAYVFDSHRPLDLENVNPGNQDVLVMRDDKEGEETFPEPDSEESDSDDDDDDDDECMRLDAAEFEVAKACSGLVDSAVCAMDSIVRTVWATRTASPREDARRELDRACDACRKIRVSTEDLVASCYSPMERGAIIEAATAMAGAAADARRACRRRRGSCGGGGDGDDHALDALIAAAEAVARQAPEGTGV